MRKMEMRKTTKRKTEIKRIPKGSVSVVSYGMAVMLLASSLLVSCGKKDEASNTIEAVKVKEMIVGDGGLFAVNGSSSTAFSQTSGDFDYSGTVQEENGAVLSFSQVGTIKQLRVKVGDRVHRGQLIGSIDPTTVRSAYDMARSTRNQAEDAFKRMKQLHDKGSLPEIKWVEAQSQLQQAVSAENIARKNLSDCNLYAPFDGIISEKNAEVGQNAAPGTPVVKLVTTNVLNVMISVPESEMAGIHVRQHASIQVQALNNRQFSGYVIEKGVIADPISRSYSVKIRVEGAKDGLLPGMVSQVSLGRISTSNVDIAPNANIVIPSQLVQLGDDNSNFVWVDEGGKAVRRTIVTGAYQSNGVSITSGLKYGDKLIVEGQQKVSTGTKLSTK